ncbi:MAG: hypothetical protein U5K74_01135 [Gemmatimonadaceae bacterium]|nr:hypothetical protein [Gemmatimonadaceae bacterium]
MTLPLDKAEDTALELRRAVLRDAGATGSVMSELLCYNRNRFVLPDRRPWPSSMFDEPSVATLAHACQ